MQPGGSVPSSATPTTTPTPPWANAMRHYIYISATHKILIIHRAALARGGTASERSRAHAECLSAAEGIVDELDRGGRQEIAMQSLWTIPYHGLAAAVVLALDMIALGGRGDAASRRREGVEKARLALEKLSPTSRIARRGLQVRANASSSSGRRGRGKLQADTAQVLADLLREAGTIARDQGRGPSDAMARVVKKIKLWVV